MRKIEFHNREKEKKEIMNILDAEPSLITFIYGPINSKKTTLMDHLIKQLPVEYAPFYINLRGRFITDYEDFLNALLIDPTQRNIKPQSRLNLHTIREVIKLSLLKCE